MGTGSSPRLAAPDRAGLRYAATRCAVAARVQELRDAALPESTLSLQSSKEVAVAEISSHIPGTFSWAELATTDQKGGVAFYRALFGWNVNEQPAGPDEIYSMFQLRDKEVAAACSLRPEERQSGVPSHWNM